MPERILQEVLNGQLSLERLLAWLRGESVEEDGVECLLRGGGRSEFAVFVFSLVHNQTDGVVERGGVRTAPAAAVVEAGAGGRAHRRAVSDPIAEEGGAGRDRDRAHKGRKVKTKLFDEDRSRECVKDASSDESRISTGVDMLALSCSTPVRAGGAPSPDWGSPSPRSRHARAADPTLGDFLCSAQKSSKKKKSKNSCDDVETKVELDLTSPEAFPEIGVRKASSLRTERRRIKPTNIDLSKKSISLNSFNCEEFQRPSPLALEDNVAFARSPGGEGSWNPGFSADRAVLRRERRRLMEKFQSMSAAGSPRAATPAACKLTPPPDRAADCVTPDITKVTFQDKLEILAEVYDSLLENNLIVSYTSELYFLMSLVVARARAVEGGSGIVSVGGEHLLASVHNCAWWGARVLWLQRAALTQLLEAGALRALGECRAVRALQPQLAKCLLNAYGLRRDSPAAAAGPPPSPSASPSARPVHFNVDTDNVDNFPNVVSFQCFKKQRDMFYDIVRWYWETGCGGGSGSGGAGAGGGPSLRCRVRALLAAGGGGTHSHLGLLIARHAKASAGGAGCASGTDDSRLCKLQRRLTRPARAASHADLYTPEEHFYREVFACCESEPFRAHVRDAIATELCALDAAVVTGGALYGTVVASRSLGKLLGLLVALPYGGGGGGGTPTPADGPLRHSLALRSYWVPPLDLIGAVTCAAERGRLSNTLPWLAGYLAASDYTALRLPYYTRLLRILRAIQRKRLAPTDTRVAATNKLFLKCILGELFARAHIPQEVLYEEESEAEAVAVAERGGGGNEGASGGPDATDLLTPHQLVMLVEVHREAALLLAGAGGGGAGGEARHVTPLRIAPPRDHHLQRRLAAAVRTSVGAGARRVIELAGERVGARARHDLVAALQSHARPDHKCSAESVARDVAGVGAAAAERAAGAAAALAEGGAARAVAALVGRHVRARLHKHAHPYLQPGAVCEAAANATRSLLATPWGCPPAPPTPGTQPAAHPGHPAARTAAAIILLKEVVCAALEGGVCAREAAGALRGAVGALREAAGPGGATGAARGPRRALLMLSLDLCVALACKRPKELCEEVLAAAESVWVACVGAPPCAPSPLAPSTPPRSPRGGGTDSRAPTPDSDGEGCTIAPARIVIAPSTPTRIVIAPSTPTQLDDTASSSNCTLDTTNPLQDPEEELMEVFPRVICARNIRLLAAGGSGEDAHGSGEDAHGSGEEAHGSGEDAHGSGSSEAGAALAALLSRLAKGGWVSERALTERCVALYRTDWPQSALGAVSACLRAVGGGGGGVDAGLLHFMADFCADLPVP